MRASSRYKVNGEVIYQTLLIDKDDQFGMNRTILFEEANRFNVSRTTQV